MPTCIVIIERGITDIGITVIKLRICRIRNDLIRLNEAVKIRRVEAGVVVHQTHIATQITLECEPKVGFRDRADIRPHLSERHIPLLAEHFPGIIQHGQRRAQVVSQEVIQRPGARTRVVGAHGEGLPLMSLLNLFPYSSTAMPAAYVL